MRIFVLCACLLLSVALGFAIGEIKDALEYSATIPGCYYFSGRCGEVALEISRLGFAALLLLVGIALCIVWIWPRLPTHWRFFRSTHP